MQWDECEKGMAAAVRDSRALIPDDKDPAKTWLVDKAEMVFISYTK